jgi:hypothetical protein
MRERMQLDYRSYEYQHHGEEKCEGSGLKGIQVEAA